MRFSLRVGEGLGFYCAWAYWFRVACIALHGVWLVLFSGVSLAQALPQAMPRTWKWASNPAIFAEGQQAAFLAVINEGFGYGGAVIVPEGACFAARPGIDWCADHPGGGPYLASFQGTCASGWTLVAPDLVCVSNVCSAAAGTKRAFNVVANDDGACPAGPSHVCFADGCRGVVASGSDCIGLPLATPPQSSWSGFAQVISSEQCGPNDLAASSTFSGSYTVSGGGAGVSSIAATSADSINLARIATNTAKIADGVAGGGSSSSGGCGGPSQAPCVLDETGVDSAGAEAMASQAGHATTLDAALDGQAAGLSLGAMPDFTGGDTSTRWKISFLPFLEASGPSECKVEWDVPLVGQVFKAGYDFCNFAEAVRQFLYWAFAVGTAFSIWNMVYRTRGGE